MYMWISFTYRINEYNNKYLYLKRELFYIVLDFFLRLRRNFVEKIQSSRHIVISYLVRQIVLDIVEAISLMAELDKSVMVRLESNGGLILKEHGGVL